jgi:hypothetical protein
MEYPLAKNTRQGHKHDVRNYTPSIPKYKGF